MYTRNRHQACLGHGLALRPLPLRHMEWQLRHYYGIYIYDIIYIYIYIYIYMTYKMSYIYNTYTSSECEATQASEAENHWGRGQGPLTI